MKKILYCIMSIYLVFATTTAAYAASSVGGWTAVDTVIAGATTTINATKSAGGKVLTSAVTVAPSAVKVGKYLIKGGGTAALLIAVPQILGEGVDWVLDPANNRIRYKDPSNADTQCAVAADCPTASYLYSVSSPRTGWYASYDAACRVATAMANAENNGNKYTFTGLSSGNWCAVDMVKGSVTKKGAFPTSRTVNPAYDPNAEDEEKYLPIDTVAAQVISNAEAGHAPSQEAVKATALEGFAAGEHDAALDAAATDAGTDAGTENPPDTENPPKDPAEPFDPAGIISAINALKALLAGILSAITGFSDLFSDTPSNPENTEVPIEDAPPVRAPSEFDTEYVNFGGMCPSFGSHDISVGSVSVPLNIDITPLCELAELVRPAVIGGAYLAATGLIVAAIREA